MVCCQGMWTTRLAGHSHNAAVVALLQHHRRLQQLGADAEGGGLEHRRQVRPRRLHVACFPTVGHTEFMGWWCGLEAG